MAILDEYVKTFPTPQNAVDIFQGEWSSIFPNEEEGPSAGGSANLFEDDRIIWAEKIIGGFQGQKVLELGPLEGGHSYMLQRRGAASIRAIEANSRAFLKCLITKEIFQLSRCEFMLGDFVEYLRKTEETFDFCLASGVLYHMREPAELISLIAGVCDKMILWTHYFDGDVIGANPILKPKFSRGRKNKFEGFGHRLYKQSYQEALSWLGFCGGSAEHSYWMSREDLFACLAYFGFTEYEVGFDHPDHPNGPSLAVVASKPTRNE